MVDNEDGGLSFFMLICTFLSETKEGIINNEDIVPVKLEKGKPSFDVLKLKDFKISGTIGVPEKKDSLSYSSLIYQIKNGQRNGICG